MSANARRGRLEQQEHEFRKATAARMPHRKIASGEDILDPRLEAPVGRLNFTGKISDEAYQAGIRYRGLAIRYLHAIGAPYPFAQCCDAEFTISGLMRQPRDAECAIWEREHNQAYSAILG